MISDAVRIGVGGADDDVVQQLDFDDFGGLAQDPRHADSRMGLGHAESEAREPNRRLGAGRRSATFET